MLRRMHDCFRDFRARLPLFLPEKEQCMKLLSALVIPVVMLLVCAMLTFSKKAGFDDFLLVDVARQGKLHDEAVDGGVVVEAVYAVE